MLQVKAAGARSKAIRSTDRLTANCLQFAAQNQHRAHNTLKSAAIVLLFLRSQASATASAIFQRSKDATVSLKSHVGLASLRHFPGYCWSQAVTRNLRSSCVGLVCDRSVQLALQLWSVSTQPQLQCAADGVLRFVQCQTR